MQIEYNLILCVYSLIIFLTVSRKISTLGASWNIKQQINIEAVWKSENKNLRNENRIQDLRPFLVKLLKSTAPSSATLASYSFLSSSIRCRIYIHPYSRISQTRSYTYT